MKNKYSLAAAVLIGGRSVRMGRPKEDIVIEGDGRTFLDRLCDEVDMCIDRQIAGRYLSIRKGQEAERTGYKNIADLYDDIGPLGGIISVLGAAKKEGYDGVLVLACDMICYTSKEIESICASYNGEDILWARTEGKDLQPLASIYGVGILEVAVKHAEKGIYRLSRLDTGAVNTGFYDSADPSAYDNINSPSRVSRKNT